MAERIPQEELARIARITDAPVRTRVDRNFGLPTGLYVATVVAYLAFLVVMASATMNPSLAIPMTIFALFVVTAFGVPTAWVTMKPDSDGGPLTWRQFRNRGIETLTGRLTAAEASLQVLILPVLILAWGMTVAIIIALT